MVFSINIEIKNIHKGLLLSICICMPAVSQRFALAIDGTKALDKLDLHSDKKSDRKYFIR